MKFVVFSVCIFGIWRCQQSGLTDVHGIQKGCSNCTREWDLGPSVKAYVLRAQRSLLLYKDVIIVVHGNATFPKCCTCNLLLNISLEVLAQFDNRQEEIHPVQSTQGRTDAEVLCGVRLGRVGTPLLVCTQRPLGQSLYTGQQCAYWQWQPKAKQ